MRKLKTSDIPVFCRCVKRLGIKDVIKKACEEANNAADIWDRGFDILWEIFDTATELQGENALYEFFAGPFEMTPAEFADLDFDALIEGMKELASENNLAGFFGYAAKLMK